MRWLQKTVAAFCVVLTFWSAIAVVAHHHSTTNESGKCTVCVAAHTASPQTASNLRTLTFFAVSTFRPEPVSAKPRLIVFALSVRPPPSV